MSCDLMLVGCFDASDSDAALAAEGRRSCSSLVERLELLADGGVPLEVYPAEPGVHVSIPWVAVERVGPLVDRIAREWAVHIVELASGRLILDGETAPPIDWGRLAGPGVHAVERLVTQLGQRG